MEVTFETLDQEIDRLMKAAGADATETRTVINVVTHIKDGAKSRAIYAVEAELMKRHPTILFDFHCASQHDR